VLFPSIKRAVTIPSPASLESKRPKEWEMSRSCIQFTASESRFYLLLSVARLRTRPHTPPTLFITLLSELVLRYFLQYFFVAFSFLAFPKEVEEPEELLQVYNRRDQELWTEDRNITGSVQNVFTSTKQRTAGVDLVATWVLKTLGLTVNGGSVMTFRLRRESGAQNDT